MTEEAVLQLHKRCFIFLSVSKALVKRLLYCTHLFGGANRASFASPTFISYKGLCNVIKSFCSRTDIYLWKHHKEKDFLKILAHLFKINLLEREFDPLLPH